MESLRRGRQSVVFDRCPAILATAAIAGKKERVSARELDAILTAEACRGAKRIDFIKGEN